jgi:hypothetical protein
VTATARPNLSDTESRELGELLTKYRDIFAVKGSDCGRTDRCTTILILERPNQCSQHLRRLPITKQAEEGKMFNDMR